MKKTFAVAVAVLLAGFVMVNSPERAEAHRSGGAFAAALIGGIALGAIIASQHRRKRHYYAYRRPYHYGYAPAYYGAYSVAPRRHYKRHHRHRHVRFW